MVERVFAMHDPIPWYIDPEAAKAPGLPGPGWYVMRPDGTSVVGPCDNPENCVLAMKDLGERKALEGRLQTRRKRSI
jgi:hypothetical protein